MFPGSLQTSNLHPLLKDAIQSIKQELNDETSMDAETTECSNDVLCTTIKTENLEDSGSEEDSDEDVVCLTKNIKVERPPDGHNSNVIYQLVRFWPQGEQQTCVSVKSENGSSKQKQVSEENLNTKQGTDVLPSSKLSGGIHCNQTPTITVNLSRTETAYNVQENVNNIQCQSSERPLFRSDADAAVTSKNDSHKSIDKIVYQCDICNNTYDHDSDLKKHRATHSSSRKYECLVCNTGFTKFSQLKDHKRKYCGRKFQCTLCDKIFETSYTLETHYKLMHNVCHYYKCNICQKEYTSERHLSAHILTHKENLEHKCKICFKTFEDVSKLNAHELVHSVRERRSNPCNKAYELPESLSQTDKLVNNKKSDIPCHILQDTSLSASSNSESLTGVNDCGTRKLRNPVRPTSIKKHKCAICDKAFMRRYDMEQHVLRHSGKKNNSSDSVDRPLDSSQNKALTEPHSQEVVGEVGKYKCNICGKIVLGQYRLKQHVSIHKNYKNESMCEESNSCDRVTQSLHSSQNKALTGLNNQEVAGEVGKYKCNICGKIVSGQYRLKQHVSIHKNYKNESMCEESNSCEPVTQSLRSSQNKARTELDSQEVVGEVGKYKCSICGKIVSGQYRLKQHVSIHKNYKNESMCEESNSCEPVTQSLRSSQNKALTELDSQEVVGEAGKYKCSICGKIVSGKYRLKQHVSMIHKNYKIESMCEESNSCEPVTQSLRSSQNTALTELDSQEVGKYKCNMCGKIVSEQHRLKQHVLLVHKIYPHHSSEDEVIIERVNEKSGKYECSICNKPFSWRSSLKRHKLTVHKAHVNVKQKMCNEPSQVNDNAAQVVKYSNNTSFINKEECSKHDNPTGNKVHNHKIDIGDNSRIYECILCNKTFDSGYSLLQHKTIVHSIANNMKMYKCDICGIAYKWACNLSQHKLRDHRNNEDGPNTECKDISPHNDDSINMTCPGSDESSEFKLSKEVQVCENNKIAINKIEFRDCNPPKDNQILQDTDMHKCNFCNKVFRQRYQLKRHKLSGHRKKFRKSVLSYCRRKFKCDICGKYFTVESSVKRHKLSVHRKNGSKSDIPSQLISDIYKCATCDKEFSSHWAMKRHMLEVHRRVTTTPGSQHVEDEARNYKCNLCGKIYSWPWGLKRHRMKAHKGCSDVKQNICIGSSEATGSTHEAFEPNNTSYVSQEEHKYFQVCENNKRAVNVKNYGDCNQPEDNQVFQDTNMLKCNLCYKIFRQYYLLKRHKLSVHMNKKFMKSGGNDIKKFKCDICDKFFTRQDSVMRHKLSVHKRDMQKQVVGGCFQPANGNPTEHRTLNKVVQKTKNIPRIVLHKCNICNKIFRWPYLLTRHKLSAHRHRKHEANKISHHKKAIRKFKCEICDSAFTLACNMRRHILSVHKIKMHEYDKILQDSSRKSPKNIHKCDICDKSFTRASHVIRHKLSRHRNEKNESDKVQSQHLSFQNVDENIASASGVQLCDKAFAKESSIVKNGLTVHENKINDSCKLPNNLSQNVSFQYIDNNKASVDTGSAELELCGEIITRNSPDDQNKLLIQRNKMIESYRAPSQNASVQHIDNNKACVDAGDSDVENVTTDSPDAQHKLLIHRTEMNESYRAPSQNASVQHIDKNKPCVDAGDSDVEIVTTDSPDAQHKLLIHGNEMNESYRAPSQNASVQHIDQNKACLDAGDSDIEIVTTDSPDAQHKLLIHRNEMNESYRAPPQNASVQHIDNNKACVVAGDLDIKLCGEIVTTDGPDAQHKLLSHRNEINESSYRALSQNASVQHIDQNKACVDDAGDSGVEIVTTNSPDAQDKLLIHRNEINESYRALSQNATVQHIDNNKACVDAGDSDVELCSEIVTTDTPDAQHKLLSHRNEINESYRAPSQPVSIQHIDKNKVSSLIDSSAEIKLQNKNIEKFRCDVCGKNFKNLHKLTQHKSVHISVKYNCNLCNQSFVEPKFLLQHMSHHSVTKKSCNNTTRCSVCKKDFASVWTLKRHAVIHKRKTLTLTNEKTLTAVIHKRKTLTLTNEKTLTNESEILKCYLCDKIFVKSFDLLQHKMVHHSNVAEFFCDVCDRGFVTADALSQHVLVHSDEN